MAGLMDSYTNYQATPSVAPMQGPSVAPAAQPSTGLISPPQTSPFWHGYRTTVWGPAAAEAERQRQRDPWREQAITTLSRELLEGRPTYKPITAEELRGAVSTFAPDLLSDQQGMAKLNTWIGMWNKEAMGAIQARQKAFEDERTTAGNLYSSGKELGAALTDRQRVLLGRHGYASLDPQSGMAYAPGAGLVPGGAPLPSPVTTMKRTGKEQVFAGYLPSPGQQEAEKIRATTPAEAARTTATSLAQQNAQTQGYRDRRLVDQQTPAGSWVDFTDPDTGRKFKVWSGGAAKVDQGRAPLDMGDLRAQVVNKALGATAQGQDPKAVLNQTEQEIYDNALKTMSAGDFMQIFGSLGKQAGAGGGGLLSVKNPPKESKSPFPQYPDAEQRADGKWYVKRDGRWNRIDP